MSKQCPLCGEDMSPRYREGAKRFAARKFCSRACARAGGRLRFKDPAEMVARYRRVKIGDRQLGEHRYFMESILGRPLLPTEMVHHRDENKYNNDPANLEVVSASEHGERHTWHPVSKVCVICDVEFTPHKTKRRRQQTCSRPCMKALISLRARQRYGKAA